MSERPAARPSRAVRHSALHSHFSLPSAFTSGALALDLHILRREEQPFQDVCLFSVFGRLGTGWSYRSHEQPIYGISGLPSRSSCPPSTSGALPPT